MKTLNLKSLQSSAKELNKQEMKNIKGGGGIHPIKPICFKCCSSDPCSPVRHYCLDIPCGD